MRRDIAGASHRLIALVAGCTLFSSPISRHYLANSLARLALGVYSDMWRAGALSLSSSLGVTSMQLDTDNLSQAFLTVGVATAGGDDSALVKAFQSYMAGTGVANSRGVWFASSPPLRKQTPLNTILWGAR